MKHFLCIFYLCMFECILCKLPYYDDTLLLTISTVHLKHYTVTQVLSASHTMSHCRQNGLAFSDIRSN